jgi:hypothetical protein
MTPLGQDTAHRAANAGSGQHLAALLGQLSPDGLVHGCGCGRLHPPTPSALEADPGRWRRIRAAILRRDGRRCRVVLDEHGRPDPDGHTVCGAHATDCGHRYPRSLGGCDHPANLEAQCRPHNRSDGASLGNALRTVTAALALPRESY